MTVCVPLGWWLRKQAPSHMHPPDSTKEQMVLCELVFVFFQGTVNVYLLLVTSYLGSMLKRRKKDNGFAI